MQTRPQPPDGPPQVVYVTDRFYETLAAYERLGFQRVFGGPARYSSGAVFRAGPTLVEVRERPK